MDAIKSTYLLSLLKVGLFNHYFFSVRPRLLRALPGKGAFNSATQTALTKTARWLLPIVLRNDKIRQLTGCRLVSFTKSAYALCNNIMYRISISSLPSANFLLLLRE